MDIIIQGMNGNVDKFERRMRKGESVSGSAPKLAGSLLMPSALGLHARPQSWPQVPIKVVRWRCGKTNLLQGQAYPLIRNESENVNELRGWRLRGFTHAG
jgi:hypothetical protein